MSENAPMWCALCGGFLLDTGPCQHCGAITTLTVTPEARRYIEARDAMLADFDERWRAMTPAQREQARREAQKGG